MVRVIRSSSASNGGPWYVYVNSIKHVNSINMELVLVRSHQSENFRFIIVSSDPVRVGYIRSYHLHGILWLGGLMGLPQVVIALISTPSTMYTVYASLGSSVSCRADSA
jgi:hypothetical protein